MRSSQEIMRSLQEIYEAGISYHHYVNFTYPLTSESFSDFQFKPQKTRESKNNSSEGMKGSGDATAVIDASSESEQSEFSLIERSLKQTKELILRIHIPESIFSKDTNGDIEEAYVNKLIDEIKCYSGIIFEDEQDRPILAYDLCGGMACKLSTESLRKITEAVKKYFKIEPLRTMDAKSESDSKAVLFSIETTPVVAEGEPEKLKEVHKQGYRRISLSVQTGPGSYYSNLNCDNSKLLYERAVTNIREAGFECLNIDVAYGFPEESESNANVKLEEYLNYVIVLVPDSVTLCRNYYHNTNGIDKPLGLSINRVNKLYRLAYDILTNKAAEYIANIGGITFVNKTQVERAEDKTIIGVITANKDSNFTCRYLTDHVIDCTPYVGLGLGAQTFVPNYMSYNTECLESYLDARIPVPGFVHSTSNGNKIYYGESQGEDMISRGYGNLTRAFDEVSMSDAYMPFQGIYLLPEKELPKEGFNGERISPEFIAKMVCASLYQLGSVNTKALGNRFHIDLKEYFEDVTGVARFAGEMKLIDFDKKIILLTEHGADFINGIIPLFYSEHSQNKLKTAVKSQKHAESKKYDEGFFMSNYSVTNCYRPLVAVDIVTLKLRRVENPTSTRKASQIAISILLNRRGDYPYMLKWTLLEDFLQVTDENIEACANRKLESETKVKAKSLLPIGVFSDNRDPRRQIVRCVYVAIMDMDKTADIDEDRKNDPIGPRWFDIRFYNKGNSNYELILTSDDVVLKSELTSIRDNNGQNTFNIDRSDDLAFDHAKIIALVIELLRSNFKKFETIFDFLPKVFTRSELQMVYEVFNDRKTDTTASTTASDEPSLQSPQDRSGNKTEAQKKDDNTTASPNFLRMCEPFIEEATLEAIEAYCKDVGFELRMVKHNETSSTNDSSFQVKDVRDGKKGEKKGEKKGDKKGDKESARYLRCGTCSRRPGLYTEKQGVMKNGMRLR